MIELLVVNGTNTSSLTPEQQKRFQYLAPNVITSKEYFRLEPEIKDLGSIYGESNEVVHTLEMNFSLLKIPKCKRMDLISAAREGNLPMIEYLINHGADVHAQNDEALIAAAENGHLPIVEFLIDHGADIHAQNDRALILAAVYGHLPVVDFLINHRADIHAQDDWALIAAAEGGHLPVIEFLVNHGVVIHAQGDRALIAAAANDRLSVVEFLVNQGADIHAQDDGALIWAAENGHLPVVEFLINHGANIQVLTPEDQACFKHFIPKVITPSEYLRLEPLVTEIQDLPGRFLMKAKKWFVLLK